MIRYSILCFRSNRWSWLWKSWTVPKFVEKRCRFRERSFKWKANTIPRGSPSGKKRIRIDKKRCKKSKSSRKVSWKINLKKIYIYILNNDYTYCLCEWLVAKQTTSYRRSEGVDQHSLHHLMTPRTNRAWRFALLQREPPERWSLFSPQFLLSLLFISFYTLVWDGVSSEDQDTFHPRCASARTRVYPIKIFYAPRNTRVSASGSA